MYIVIVVNHVFISHIDPPRFTNIIVKLGFNEVSGDTELYIMYSVS